MSSAKREGSDYHFESVLYDSTRARTHDLPVVRQTLYHWAITPVSTSIVALIFFLFCYYQIFLSLLHISLDREIFTYSCNSLNHEIPAYVSMKLVANVNAAYY